MYFIQEGWGNYFFPLAKDINFKGYAKFVREISETRKKSVHNYSTPFLEDNRSRHILQITKAQSTKDGLDFIRDIVFVTLLFTIIIRLKIKLNYIVSQSTTVKLSFPNRSIHRRSSRAERTIRKITTSFRSLYHNRGEIRAVPSSTRFETKLLRFGQTHRRLSTVVDSKLRCFDPRKRSSPSLPRTVELFIELPRQEDDTKLCVLAAGVQSFPPNKWKEQDTPTCLFAEWLCAQKHDAV